MLHPYPFFALLGASNRFGTLAVFTVFILCTVGLGSALHWLLGTLSAGADVLPIAVPSAFITRYTSLPPPVPGLKLLQ